MPGLAPRANVPFSSFGLCGTLGFVVALSTAAPAQNGWTSSNPTVSPPSRGWQGLTFDLGRSKTVLFGGWDGAMFGDHWEWDGTTWTQRTFANSPSPRCCHAFGYDYSRNVVVLFGGSATTGAGDMNDTWEFDGTNWTQLQPTAQPSARRISSMTYDPVRGTMILFGGGFTSSGNPVFNDTWDWNGVGWTQLQPANSPSARWGAGLATDLARSNIVLFGGQAGSSTPSSAETWTWDGTDWTLRSPTVSPTGRTSSGMTFEGQNQVVVCNGGEQPTPSSDTWLWDGFEWRADQRPGGPAARSRFAMAFDLVRNRNVMFGSSAVSGPQATWEYDAGVMARWLPTPGGCAGPQGIPALAPAAGSLPILGTSFGMELSYGASNNLAIFVFGFSTQQWSGGTLPQSLAGFGMPGCVLQISPDTPVFGSMVAGTATWSWALPNDPTFAGLEVFTQGFVSDPAANAAGALVSGHATIRIGAW